MHVKPNLEFSLAAILLTTLTAWSQVQAEEGPDTIVNPQYTAWEHFKPGSSATLVMDFKAPAGPVHVELTTVLKQVDDSAITLDLKVVRTIAGQDQPVPDSTTKYEHFMKRASLKKLSDQNVTVNGKTYRCKVYEVTSGKVGADNRSGGTSKLYLNEKVPGGVVKMQLPSASGEPIVMNLKEYHVVGKGK